MFDKLGLVYTFAFTWTGDPMQSVCHFLSDNKELFRWTVPINKILSTETFPVNNYIKKKEKKTDHLLI